MQIQNLIKTWLFSIFFSAAATTLAIVMLTDELMTYTKNKQLLNKQLIVSQKLQSLNGDYDALLKQISKNPNLLDRVTKTGSQNNDPNILYPDANDQQLLKTETLLQKLSQNTPETIPIWLQRCSNKKNRAILFVCGALLATIAFACFRKKSNIKNIMSRSPM